MKKILIATPMYGGMCAGEYTRSMIHVPIALNSNGIDVSFAFIFNNSLVQSARNQLAGIFMRHDFTHMMFVDADIKFDVNDLLHMINVDLPVIAGIYPKKEINWGMVEHASKNGVPAYELKNYTGSLVVNLADGVSEQLVDPRQPIEVTRIGTGFMLIKRETMEELCKHTDTYVDDDGSTLNEFFYLSKDPETGRQMSEDYSFCDLCRKHGIKIYAAPWARLAHAGTYLFEGSVIPAKA